MKLIILFLSLPHIFTSFILVFLPRSGIRDDLEKCINVTKSRQESMPQVFIDALVACEDHRNLMHPGIDPISIVRAIFVYVIHGKTQGASTIEQQFVRVVLNRYEKTIYRKFHEQIIAILLASRIDKNKIASSYLSVAFYGSGSIGTKGLKSKFGNELSGVSFEDALKMMVQLKYPRPLFPNEKWQKKIDRRVDGLLKNAKNFSIDQIYLRDK